MGAARMKNHYKLASGVDTLPLALELLQHPELWNVDAERLGPNTPHRDSDDIWVRHNDRTKCSASGDWTTFNDEHDSVWYPAIYALPSARKLIFDLMARVQGERLGGILLWRVKPGQKIHPHADFGWHAGYYDKFNICIQGQAGCVFNWPDDGESIFDSTGDVHRFTNHSRHEVLNQGLDDYIVLCVCIRTHHYESRFIR